MIKGIIFVLSLVFFLTGCEGRIDGATVRGDGYRIEVEGDRHWRDGWRHEDGPPHCPPGHRKKGWCD